MEYLVGVSNLIGLRENKKLAELGHPNNNKKIARLAGWMGWMDSWMAFSRVFVNSSVVYV